MNCFLHIAMLVALTVATAASARADAATQREDQFKAAYVFNFVKFVAWPSTEATDTLTICFVGGEGVYTALNTGIANKHVGARALAALKMDESQTADACDALYIEASLAAGYPLPLKQAVLTISDAADFTTRGGMIGLFTENHRLRFAINVQSAQQAGLRISSDLLKLAADVQRGPR
ncbi:YfiR family protein [Peristeroidobacter agariperforans]|uniref:YfiR family protein n=1 Tax=Peristeroidobacter agariperforans TaxID=268404 RepID=UPI00101D77CC|nr:YfiR family protein [Peristeroidobacter agariperforans]